MSDFDDLIASTQPTPVSPAAHAPPAPAPTVIPQVVAAPSTDPARRGVHPFWPGLFAFVATMFFVLWLSTWIEIPTPGPHVDPVDGSYVAIFYDDAEKGNYTPDQITALDSAAIAQFLDETVDGWKKIDVDPAPNLKNLNPVYAEMAGEHMSKLPWAVVRSGRKLGSEPITTADDLIKLINRTVK